MRDASENALRDLDLHGDSISSRDTASRVAVKTKAANRAFEEVVREFTAGEGPDYQWKPGQHHGVAPGGTYAPEDYTPKGPEGYTASKSRLAQAIDEAQLPMSHEELDAFLPEMRKVLAKWFKGKRPDDKRWLDFISHPSAQLYQKDIE